MLFTQFLAEFFGLFLIIFSASMYVHKDMYMELIRDIEHHRATIYVLSIVGVMLGLLVVLTHNVWHQNLLAVIITLVGWVILIKSVLYLALPNRMIHKIVQGMALVKNYHLYVVIAFIVGLFLAVNGIWGY